MQSRVSILRFDTTSPNLSTHFRSLGIKDKKESVGLADEESCAVKAINLILIDGDTGRYSIAFSRFVNSKYSIPRCMKQDNRIP